MLAVDHARGLEPSPLLLCPGNVLGLPRRIAGAVREMRRDRQKQLIGNRVFVGALLAPPDSASAGLRVPAAGHVRKYGTGHSQIPGIFCQVVGVDPGQRPPALVVVIIIQKGLAARPLRGHECVGEDRQVFRRSAGAHIVRQHRDRIGGVPPAGSLVEAGPRYIPPLERSNANPGTLQITRRLAARQRSRSSGEQPGPRYTESKNYDFAIAPHNLSEIAPPASNSSGT